MPFVRALQTMAWSAGGGGVGRSAQSHATIGAPGGICDTPRRWRMPLAKAASEMVRDREIDR
jgi:hypothetical protein